MAIRDEYLVVLRGELGAGHETDTLSVAMREYVKRSLKPQVLAARKSVVDDSALVSAREAKEQALRDEEDTRNAKEASMAAQLDKDVEGL